MTMIFILDENGDARQTTTREFWDDNADALDFADLEEFRDALRQNGEVLIGGGAAPLYSVQTPEFAGGLVSEAAR